MTAYVLIQKQPDSKPVGGFLRSMAGIVSADDLTGAYDAIALASADSSRDLFERVLPEIRKLPGVTQALPAPLMGPFVEPSTRTHRFDSSGKAA